jgi:hypothetical protein
VKLSFEKMFAMGAFDALRTLREQTALHHDRSLLELIDLLRSTDASVAGLDFLTALVLHDLVPLDTEIEIPHMFYRSCIRAVILDNSIWSKSITLGRSRFFGQLSRDELLCFRAASLANDPPEREVVAWWDEMAEHIALAKKPADLFSAGQESESIQQLQHSILARMAMRGKSNAKSVSDVLAIEQQRESLLITVTGVVVNGNRRLSHSATPLW